MKKILAKILTVLFVMPLFLFTVSADQGSFTPYFFGGGYLEKISNLDATMWLMNYSSNTFGIYVPYKYNSSEGQTVIVSGSLDIVLDTYDVGNLTFSNFKPRYLSLNYNDSNNTYARQLDLTTRYNTTIGDLNFAGGGYGIAAYSQTHFLSDLKDDDRVVINYVFVVSNGSYQDFTLTFTTPTITDKIYIEGYDYNVTYVDSPSTEVQDAIGVLTQTNSTGFNSVSTAVQALNVTTQSNFETTSNMLDNIKSNIDSLNSNMSTYVYDAIDSWHNEQSDYVTSGKLDGNVSDIKDQIDNLYDQSEFENIFRRLYSTFSGQNTRAPMTTVLTIPAGTVSIAGTNYTFWESTTLDFGPYFDEPIVQVLLVPLRFVIAVGFIRYCLHWIGKLIDLITLHIKPANSSSASEGGVD